MNDLQANILDDLSALLKFKTIAATVVEYDDRLISVELSIDPKIHILLFENGDFDLQVSEAIIVEYQKSDLTSFVEKTLPQLLDAARHGEIRSTRFRDRIGRVKRDETYFTGTPPLGLLPKYTSHYSPQVRAGTHRR